LISLLDADTIAPVCVGYFFSKLLVKLKVEFLDIPSLSLLSSAGIKIRKQITKQLIKQITKQPRKHLSKQLISNR